MKKTASWWDSEKQFLPPTLVNDASLFTMHSMFTYAAGRDMVSCWMTLHLLLKILSATMYGMLSLPVLSTLCVFTRAAVCQTQILLSWIFFSSDELACMLLSPYADRHVGDISFTVCLFLYLFVSFVHTILVTDISGGVDVGRWNFAGQ